MFSFRKKFALDGQPGALGEDHPGSRCHGKGGTGKHRQRRGTSISPRQRQIGSDLGQRQTKRNGMPAGSVR